MLTYEETREVLDYYLDSMNEVRDTFGIQPLEFEKDLLVKEVMRRRKNDVSDKESELAGGTSGDAQRETEVIHEVQD